MTTALEFPQPLRLAVGSHERGSGKGCAMNVISYENGDTTITDYPACSDRFLSRLVQSINDDICTHRDGDLLCSPCSMKVLALGHRTVGTSGHNLSNDELHRVWVTIAVEEARSVLHLATGEAHAAALRAIIETEGWLSGGPKPAYAYTAYAAYTAYDAAAYAYTASAASAASAAYAYAAYYAAAYAAAYAAFNATAATADRVQRAHHIINRFIELTGVQPTVVSADKTVEAVRELVTVR